MIFILRNNSSSDLYKRTPTIFSAVGSDSVGSPFRAGLFSRLSCHGVVVGTRLVNAVMDAYSPAQKAVLKQKAEEAGVSLDAWLGDDEVPSTTSTPA